MNRADFQQLAELRLQDAEALLQAGRYEAAYYLAGYAIECALKACIAKRTEAESSPHEMQYDCIPIDLEWVRQRW
jgi:HEPN domain-containing protein